MSAADLIGQAEAWGVHLWAEGPALRYRGSPEALEPLLPELKAHKSAILAALSQAPAERDLRPMSPAGAEPRSPGDSGAIPNLEPEFGPLDPEPADEWQRRIWAGWQFHLGKWFPRGQCQPSEPHQVEPAPDRPPRAAKRDHGRDGKPRHHRR
jgi:hypothetical protein